jgi:2-C-methyl-D-erythritol 4-phosphate cytidylyltransferase
MGTPIKKQYLKIVDREVLEWTFVHLCSESVIDEVVFVVGEEAIETMKDKVIKWKNESVFKGEISVVVGGLDRQNSVYNGLKKVSPESEIVIIHDGVRPFAMSNWLPRLIDPIVEGKTKATAVGYPSVDTLKSVDDAHCTQGTVDREHVWGIQTPQVFLTATIKKAHQLAAKNKVICTDDTALLELIGETAQLISFNEINLKLTSLADVKIAELILKNKGESDV